MSNASTSRPDPGPPIPPNSLSVVLLSRGDGTFHWALALAVPGARFAFRKLHATQLKGPSWEFEDVVHDIGAMEARRPVCVVVQIGYTATGTGAPNAPSHTPDAVARLVRAIPLVLPAREVREGAFNCRVWVREALRVLHDHGVVDIADIEKLEDEFVALGEENDAGVVRGGGYWVYWSENVGAVAREGEGAGVAAEV